jgi:hypothetical protein
MLKGGDSDNRKSLFELSYQNAMNESYIEWVPTHDKVISILTPGSTFMNLISEMQEYRMPI